MANGIGRRLFCFFLLIFSLNAFAAGPSRRSYDPDWQKRWWLEKTVRKLRGGAGLLPSEDADALLRLSKEEIVAKLTADPRFADMVLDFNLYFLGFSPDSLKKNGAYNEQIFDFPAALTSARETFAGGDYFRLFDLYTQPYISPLKVRYRYPGEEQLSNRDVILQRAQTAMLKLKETIDYAKTDATATPETVCNKYFLDNGRILFELGVNSSFQFNAVFDLNYNLNLEAACAIGPLPSVPVLTGFLDIIYAMNEKLLPALMPYEESQYSIGVLQDIRSFDTSGIGFASPWLAWSSEQRVALRNSSTNFNRKRAAYVLKRFFCDDLTPIAVENPEAHTRGGSHGSETSCYACHYKLDPMAGYFRDYGFLFTNFSKYPDVIFDDLAKAPRAVYEQNWKAPAGSSREWNVGYIRSVSDESLNDYGSTLEDLHGLLRRAPEVKRCLSRRVFEYMVSDNQTIDAGYLDYLSEEFTKRSVASSGDGMKWLISTLALSNSFNEPDLATDECYDFKPGTTPGERPPCRVAFIFERNCVSCHSSTAGAGRLNLAGWITLPDGTKTFPHLDRTGAQRPARETFEKISDRLTTADENRRMPLGSFMSSQERQELYLWVQEQL